MQTITNLPIYEKHAKENLPSAKDAVLLATPLGQTSVDSQGKSNKRRKERSVKMKVVPIFPSAIYVNKCSQ
jgi:hypothetical protein